MTAVPWIHVQDEVPDLAAAITARFMSARHHVLASLRADGSPRVSGTEVQFFEADLTVGSMPGSVKARDLRRAASYALHAHTGDGTIDGGDAKLAGTAVEVTDPAVLTRFLGDRNMPDGPFELFRLLIAELVLTSVHPDGDRLVITWWKPGAGLRVIERH